MVPIERGGITKTGIILFQKYKLLEQAGKSNGSKVYVAEHIKLHTLRAVKCIDKEKIPYERLMKEAVYLKNLNHPGIPALYDIEEDTHYFYMIEELIQGESLKSMFDRKKYFSIEEIIEYGVQLCEIISYLHGQEPYPIVHADIAPANIMIEKKKVKLVDFGNAIKLIGKEQKMDVYGTKSFMAPEETGYMVCSVQTDIYGVCAVINCMYQHKKAESSKKDVQQKQGKLEQIIKKGISNTVEERYESIAQLQERLMELREPKKGRFTSKPESIRRLSGITIGCIGITPAAGVTTMAFHVADEVKKQGRTALLEFGEQKDLGRWKLWQQEQGRYMESIKYGFRCDEIDFYPMADTDVFLYVLNAGYYAVVVDFGLAENMDVIMEFQKCNKKVILGNYCVWNYEQSLRRLETLLYEMNTKDWTYLTFGNDKRICRILENKLGIHIQNSIPLKSDSLYENIVKDIVEPRKKGWFLKHCFFRLKSYK